MWRILNLTPKKSRKLSALLNSFSLPSQREKKRSRKKDERPKQPGCHRFIQPFIQWINLMSFVVFVPSPPPPASESLGWIRRRSGRQKENKLSTEGCHLIWGILRDLRGRTRWPDFGTWALRTGIYAPETDPEAKFSSSSERKYTLLHIHGPSFLGIQSKNKSFESEFGRVFFVCFFFV